MHFFISYAKADTRTLASQLFTELNNLDGVSAWMDTSLRTGKSWAAQIQREILKADYMIVLLSRDVHRDPEGKKGRSFVLNEIDFAQQLKKPIIPIMAEDTYAPVQIAGIQYIDFANNPDMGMQQLLKEVNVQMSGAISVAKPPRTSPTPKLIPSSSSTRIPFYAIIGIVIALIFGIGFVILSNPSDNGANEAISTATGNPTSEATEIADNPTDTPMIASTQIPTEESTDTNIPENTPLPTDTPDIEAVAQVLLAQQTAQKIVDDATVAADQNTLEMQRAMTQQANETATATVWTKTPTPNFTASVEALLTEWAEGTQTRQPLDWTATATLWTATPTPTFTPIPPTLSPLELAKTPVTSNADWTPYEQDFDGVAMVLVPAGQFAMGSTEEEIDYGFELCQQAADDGGAGCQRSWFEDEAPNDDNTQIFTEPFWVDKYEVSRAQYQECVDATICSETSDSEFSTEPDQPINRVTWSQAKDYCEYCNAELPTEAEWEYVARGPDGLLFPWGNDFTGNEANHCDKNCSEQDWASGYNYVNQENDDGYAITAPVTAYEQGESWVGARNMAGNLWEWTSSLYDASYPYSNSQEDESDSTNTRVVRGGSFNSSINNLRSANRILRIPPYAFFMIGFRCVRS